MKLKRISIYVVTSFLSVGITCGVFYVYGKIIPKPIVATAYARKLSAFQSIPRTEGEIIFLGHSQVNEFLLQDYLPEYKIRNMGIGGDSILGVINRLDIALQYQPKCILLEIGINDIYNRVPVDTINTQYENLLRSIRENSIKLPPPPPVNYFWYFSNWQQYT